MTATFEDTGLDDSLVQTLHRMGLRHPTEVQKQAIPAIIKGHDIQAIAPTGTGKTAAFALPVVHKLLDRPALAGAKPVRALILSPTRELTQQTAELFRKLCRHTPLRVSCIFGGVDKAAHMQALRQGTDILIATPGRLADFLNMKILDLDAVNILVLDEADRMLGMGFIDLIQHIAGFVPPYRQTLLFSATMPPELASLIKAMLHKPVKINLGARPERAHSIRQHVIFVNQAQKLSSLLLLLKKRMGQKVIVFARTRKETEAIGSYLKKNALNAGTLHGDKSQKDRNAVLNSFRSGQSLDVMVATDVAARGIDIEKVDLVINFDVPEAVENYIHRIGRTGRAGCKGASLTLCDIAERARLRAIEQQTKARLLAIELQTALDRTIL